MKGTRFGVKRNQHFLNAQTYIEMLSQYNFTKKSIVGAQKEILHSFVLIDRLLNHAYNFNVFDCFLMHFVHLKT